MSLETEFSEILSELTKFRSAIGRAQAGMRSTKEREMLGELIGQMDQARVDAESAVPEAIKRIHEVARDVQTRAEEQRAKLAQLQKQIEERKANPPQPPAIPPKVEIPLDPNLGAQLSAELLARVAPPKVSSLEQSTQVVKEIWEDWNWENYGKN